MYKLSVVVVRIFNATMHTRHIQGAAIGMYIYLYSRAFMDHPCILGAAVHQAPPGEYELNPGHVEYELGVLMVWKLSRPEQGSNTPYPAWKSSALTTRPPSPLLDSGAVYAYIWNANFDHSVIHLWGLRTLVRVSTI